MRVTLFQHVAFEGPGAIQDWADQRGHDLRATHVDGSALSQAALAAADALIVMGGPMGVDDHAEHPWLASEKRFVAEAARSGRPVLGICLGAQILANVMGARVRRNPYKEIGWHTITWSQEARQLAPFAHVPATSVAFHWHGDTFDLPSGTLPVASSAVCARQGFATPDGRVIGLQFHLEMRPEDVRLLARNGADELAAGGTHVQTEPELLADATEHSAKLLPLFFLLLDRWAATAKTASGC